MRFALNQLVKELGEKEGKETFEWYCKTYNVGIADPMPETVKYEIFGTDKQFVEIDDLNAKLSALRKFFRDRDKDKRYNYKVRICSAENDGKDPIHAYKYPTGTAYADIRFEIHSEGSSGWDYLRIAYKFDNTNEVRIDCDALPEYKELIAQLQQSDNNSTYAFAKEIAALYEQGERLDWVKAKKLAAPHRIESEQAIMQACELAVVLSARKIAQNGQSIAQRYAALKDLYEQQVTIRPLDTQSKLLQQYSTPCPLAFLLGEYVKGATDLKEHQQYYLEPSAGNGMLTIALPTDKVFANDLDEIRYQNLLVQGFHKVENGDALRMIPNPNFRGIITNPPFAKLAPKDKIERHGWEINTLDYKMAVLALDNMANHGRAAIIVGGKMWNSYWKQQSETSKKRVLFGQWKTFLGYLYATYNVEDVIYINGDNIYRKQGTTYPIVVILINRRWDEYSEEHKPNYVFDPERDTIIDTFDQLFERMMKYLQSAPSSLDDINVEEIKRKLEDGTAASMVDQIYQKANAAAEEEEKRERDIAARKRKFAFKLKLQLQLKEQDKELVRKTHAEVSRMIDEYFEKHPIDIDKIAEKRGYLRDNIAYCQEKIEKEREKGKRTSQSKIDAYEERIDECQQMLQTHAMQKPQVQVGAWYVNNKHHDMVTYIYDNWGGKYQRRIYMNGQYKSSNEFTDSEIFLQTHTKIDPPQWAGESAMGEIDDDLLAMKQRITEWLSPKILSEATGKTRDEIIEMYGNELLPIAYVPKYFANKIDSELTDFYVYCGKGYFIDHAVNHHSSISPEKYVLIQDVLNDPDEIRKTITDGHNSYIFIKKLNRYNAVVLALEVSDNGKMILHKSFFDQKKKPYANVGTRLYIVSSEDGDLPHLQGCSSIIRTKSTRQKPSCS